MSGPADPWRIDRRTFLKAMGIGTAGLFAASPVAGPLRSWLSEPATAASDPISDLALELEFDFERMFRFVSEHIRYEPYTGMLRGPRGTLMARAGNSADQAALLAELLTVSGIPHRYAFGALDDEAADAILSGAVTDVATARQQVLEALAGLGEGGRPLRVDEPDAETRARLDDAAAQADRVVAWARERTASAVDDIEAALRSAGITLPGSFSGIDGLEREQHVWLQAASGPGWLDLDPSLPGALPGDVPASPAQVAENMPDELRHVIGISIVGETASSGALQEETLIELSEFADALAGQPIGVLNMEQDGLKGVGVSILSAVEGGTVYVPCIVLGDNVFVASRIVHFAGSDGADPLDDAPETAAIADGEPTAEWVQVTLASPGSEPIVVRRPVFDRVGPAARSKGPLDLSALAPAELASIEPDAPPDYMPAQTTHWLTVHTGIVGGEALGDALGRSETHAALAGVVHGYHVAREAGGIALAMPDGVRSFSNAPNLVSMTVGQELGPDGELLIRPSLDIWHRSFGVLPTSDQVPTTSPPMLAGVVSHVTERLLFGEAVPDGPEPVAVASVGAVFDAARSQGVPLRVVRDPNEVTMLPFPPDALARLVSSLEGGWIGVVPERPVAIAGSDRSGWWLVDPATGAAVDQLDTGGGQSTSEYGALLRAIAVDEAPAMVRLGACTAFVAIAVLGLWAAGFATGSQSGAASGQEADAKLEANVLAIATFVSSGFSAVASC